MPELSPSRDSAKPRAAWPCPEKPEKLSPDSDSQAASSRTQKTVKPLKIKQFQELAQSLQ